MIGVAVGFAAAGVRAGRFMVGVSLLPARTAWDAAWPRLQARGEAAFERFDDALAGPLTEHVARSLGEHRVIERIADELIANGTVTALFDQALQAGLAEQIADRLLAPDVLDSPVLLRDHRPRDGQRGDAARDRAHRQQPRAADGDRRADQRAGRGDGRRRAPAHRLDGRRRRAHGARLAATAASDDDVSAIERPYAGIVSRTVALAIDAATLTIGFAVASGVLRPHPVALHGRRGQLARRGARRRRAVEHRGGAATSCSSGRSPGETPGMRLMALRGDQREPAIRRGFGKVAGAPRRHDPRGDTVLRRLPARSSSTTAGVGLQDMLAGTTVVYAPKTAWRARRRGRASVPRADPTCRETASTASWIVRWTCTSGASAPASLVGRRAPIRGRRRGRQRRRVTPAKTVGPARRAC